MDVVRGVESYDGGGERPDGESAGLERVHCTQTSKRSAPRLPALRMPTAHRGPRSIEHVPNAGAELYSLRDAATLVMFPMVFSVAVTATMSCHVGNQPGPWGRSASGECQLVVPSEHAF